MCTVGWKNLWLSCTRLLDGKVAAATLQNKEAAFEGADMSTKLKLLGIDVCSIGDAHAQSEGAKAYTFNNEVTGVYKKIVTNEKGDKLIGAIMVGEADDYGTWLQLALNETTLPCDASQLLVPSDGEVAEFEMPDSAVICSCYDVTKGDILAAVQVVPPTLVQSKRPHKRQRAVVVVLP